MGKHNKMDKPDNGEAKYFLYFIEIKNIVSKSSPTQVVCAEARKTKRDIELNLLPPCEKNTRFYILHANSISLIFQVGLMLQLGFVVDRSCLGRMRIRFTELYLLPRTYLGAFYKPS